MRGEGTNNTLCSPKYILVRRNSIIVKLIQLDAILTNLRLLSLSLILSLGFLFESNFLERKYLSQQEDFSFAKQERKTQTN